MTCSQGTHLEKIVTFAIYDHAQMITPKFLLCTPEKVLYLDRKLGLGHPILFIFQCHNTSPLMKPKQKMFHRPNISTILNIKLALSCLWTLFSTKHYYSAMKCTRKANAATTFLEYAKSGENRYPTMQKPMGNTVY